jgi:hypothetical protein
MTNEKLPGKTCLKKCIKANIAGQTQFSVAKSTKQMCFLGPKLF